MCCFLGVTKLEIQRSMKGTDTSSKGEDAENLTLWSQQPISRVQILLGSKIHS